MSEAVAKTCFVIGPIGDPESSTRRDADWLLKGIIQPVLEEKFKFQVKRADEIARPGMLDSQVINAVLDADLVIADLSDNNPNAFYELALRHMIARPVIHMTRELPTIPFDVRPYSTIPFSNASFEDVERAKSELEKHVSEAVSDDHEVDNPVTTARGKKKWRETATDNEKMLSNIVENLATRVAEIERHFREFATNPPVVNWLAYAQKRPEVFRTLLHTFDNAENYVQTPLPLRSGAGSQVTSNPTPLVDPHPTTNRADE